MHTDPEIICHRLLTVGLGAHILCAHATWSCVCIYTHYLVVPSNVF